MYINTLNDKYFFSISWYNEKFLIIILVVTNRFKYIKTYDFLNDVWFFKYYSICY